MIKARRVVVPSTICGLEYDRNLNTNTLTYVTPYFLDEVTDSGNHPGWIYQQDGGGYFDHQLTEYRHHPSTNVRVSATSGGANPFLSYTGCFVCARPSSSMPIGDGDPWAATAYKAMKPTKFDYSLFNMVYELKDIPHMLLQLKNFWSLELFKKPAGLWRESGNRFLGQVFGWNPLVNDVMTLIDKQQKIQQRIGWLIRNQGKWIPRKWEASTNAVTTSGDWITDYGALNPVLTTSTYIQVPQYRDTTWYNDRIWATAQFKYFLPEVPPGVELKDVVKRSLQGFHSIRADQLYAAIPWSWLVDWCLNVGTLLQNMDPGVADRIAARRFYMMREMETVKIRHARGIFRGYGGGPNVPVEASVWSRYLHQTRRIGLPFYPGNPNNLSGMQTAILGALGASRL